MLNRISKRISIFLVLPFISLLDTKAYSCESKGQLEALVNRRDYSERSSDYLTDEVLTQIKHRKANHVIIGTVSSGPETKTLSLSLASCEKKDLKDRCPFWKKSICIGDLVETSEISKEDKLYNSCINDFSIKSCKSSFRQAKQDNDEDRIISIAEILCSNGENGFCIIYQTKVSERNAKAAEEQRAREIETDRRIENERIALEEARQAEAQQAQANREAWAALGEQFKKSGDAISKGIQQQYYQPPTNRRVCKSTSDYQGGVKTVCQDSP